MKSPRKKETKTCKSCNTKFHPLYTSKGIYCSTKCMGLDRSGDKHNGWKGDDISYQGIHSWFRDKKADECNFCGSIERLELALIEGKEHTRDLANYHTLCVPCHRKYDAHEPWNKGISRIKYITCGHCGEFFKPRRKTTRFCSNSCSNKGCKKWEILNMVSTK